MNNAELDLNGFTCAIFDLDGTLLDSTGVWEKIDIDFLGKRGIPVPGDFMEAIKTHNFRTGSVYVAERFELAESPEQIAREWYEMAVQAYACEIQLKKDAGVFLRQLKRMGIKLAVATSSDRSLYEPCLKRNGIYGLFDSFTQTDEVLRGKGHPDVYELAARRSGAAVSDCMVFEDILRGAQGAVRGGFFTVGVYDAASAKDAWQMKRICHAYIEAYTELLYEKGKECAGVRTGLPGRPKR